MNPCMKGRWKEDRLVMTKEKGKKSTPWGRKHRREVGGDEESGKGGERVLGGIKRKRERERRREREISEETTSRRKEKQKQNTRERTRNRPEKTQKQIDTQGP